MNLSRQNFHPIAAHWPYPRWIAHRGAGLLAPENTLAAFATGAQYGYRMFECDVKLSADDVPFLLHDDTLERTTSGVGLAGSQHWAALATLDAGTWHSAAFAGERLPTLDALATWCRRQGFGINLEIKPSPGTGLRTGRVVARCAAHLWQDAATPPLLTSFCPEALAGAQEAATHLPRGLLVHSLRPGWLETAVSLGCVALVFNHELWNEATMAQAHAAGLRTLAYTVNDEATTTRLVALGIDGIITDQVDLFAPTR